MARPPQTPTQVAHAYYAIAGVYTLSASLIWGINTLFLLHAGLTLQHVFFANAVFTGSMALFEVPTGLVADTAGRRVSFLWSVSLLCVGTALYVVLPMIGGGFLAFCLVSVLLGLGYTFYSGAVEAWMVDALRAVDADALVDRVLARGALVASIAMLIGTVSGGLLGDVNLAAPYVLRCILLVVAFVLGAFAMSDAGFVPRKLEWRQVPLEVRRVAQDSWQIGWQHPAVRSAILAGAVPAIFLEWGFHGWQPYLLGLLHSSAVWVTGAIAAGISLATIGGNAIVDWAARFCGKRTTLLLAAGVAYSAAAVGVGLVGSFWAALTLYLVVMLSVGVMTPVRQAYIHSAVPTAQRATVLSFTSLWASLASMGGQLGLGALAGQTSLARGYLVGGAITALALPLVYAMRRRGGVHDLIIGRAGWFGACTTRSAPDGIAVAAVRTTA